MIIRIVLQVLLIASTLFLCVGMALGYQSRIIIDCSQTTGKVSPLVFGNNIQWAYGGKYGRGTAGILDIEKNKFDPILKEVYLPIIRYPGGQDAEFFKWYDAIGDPSTRRKIATFYGNYYFPYLGPDEFFRLLNLKGAQGLNTVNFKNGSPKEAADWVEYCNGKEDTYWGALRASNGFSKPYNIKYWEIGNENYLSHGCDIMKYTSIASQYIDEMKKRDNSIKIGVVAADIPHLIGANDTDKEWNNTLLTQLGNKIDFLSIHLYGAGKSENIIHFYWNDSRKMPFHTTQSDTVTFNISAKGTYALGVPPIMECQVDNLPIHQISVNSVDWGVYSFNENIGPGSHQLRVSFINDKYQPPEDRNLFINDIKLLSSAVDQQVSIRESEHDISYKTLMAYPMKVASRLDQLRDIINLTVPQYANKIKLAITEYNAAYGDYREPDQINQFKSGLMLADLLHTFINKNIFIANFWLLMHDRFSLIRPSQTYIKRPSYYVLKMLSLHSRNILIKTICDSPEFISPFDRLSVPYLSALCSMNSNKTKLYLTVINKNEFEAITSTISLQNCTPKPTATVITLTASSVNDDNEKNPDLIKPTQTIFNTISNSFSYTFPPRSITLLEINGDP